MKKYAVVECRKSSSQLNSALFLVKAKDDDDVILKGLLCGDKDDFNRWKKSKVSIWEYHQKGTNGNVVNIFELTDDYGEKRRIY